jgi:citrate lyase subunit beta/citryl-CoA lyase
MKYFRPRRSMLYSPANNLRFLEKAAALLTDCVAMDLEETIVPEAKEAARANVVKALNAYDYGQREVIVRVNRLGSPWIDADLRAVGAARTPSCSRGSRAARRRSTASPPRSRRRRHLPVMMMIETPFGVLRSRRSPAPRTASPAS